MYAESAFMQSQAEFEDQRSEITLYTENEEKFKTFSSIYMTAMTSSKAST